MTARQICWYPVRTSVIIKSIPNFPQSCPKSSNTNVFILAPQVTKYLDYFCKKICHQELSKIAQSGRTADILVVRVFFVSVFKDIGPSFNIDLSWRWWIHFQRICFGLNGRSAANSSLSLVPWTKLERFPCEM